MDESKQLKSVYFFSEKNKIIFSRFQKSEKLRERRVHYANQLDTLKQMKYTSEQVTIELLVYKKKHFEFLGRWT